MKKRRGRKEIEMSRRRKGGLKRREVYTVVCSQSVLRSSDTHKDSQNWIGKRRGKEEIASCSEVENRESKVGESNQHTPE